MRKSLYSVNALFVLIFFALLFPSVEMHAQEPSRQMKSRGMIASPIQTKIKQANGEEIILRGMGDRVVHWYETVDGRTVLKNNRGEYVYATLDEFGDMQPSDQLVKAGDFNWILNSSDKIFYSSEQLQELEENYISKSPDSKSNPSPFPSLGNNKVLVILVEFPDKKSIKTQAQISSLMNDPNYNGIGSFRDYYLNVSYGNLVLQSTVVDWLEVSEDMAYYGSNDEAGYDQLPQELVREAIDQLEIQGFDFSQFDNDNDGYVDEVVVFHAGFAEEYTDGGDSCIWSHAFHLGDLSTVYDGVTIDNYVIVSELYGNSGDTISGIGTVTHEFAHSLAIPDLYDVDYGGTGGYAFDLNFWDLMAAGAWNNKGQTPASINAWLKEYMGWMKIPEIHESGSFTLNNAYENKEAYRINTPTDNEFFILENRQWFGFDAELPGYGMLIYHIDMNYEGWETGYINMDPAHQGFDLEEADNIKDSLTIDGDAFPGYDGITVFNDTTVPSANTWNGQESFVNIHNIVQAGYVVSFDYGNAIMEDAPPGWDLNPAAYSDTAFVNAMVMIVNDTAARGYLAAFVGDEVRGVRPVSFYPDSNNYVFELEVYSNQATGEDMSFRYYDPVLDSTYLLMDSLAFVSSSISGSLQDPFYFNSPTAFSKSFIQGWNWFSVNVNHKDMSPGNIMTGCNSDRDYLKSQTMSTTYYEDWGWYGSLIQMNTAEMYMLKAGSDCAIEYTGAAENPHVQIIDLFSGWNWFGYVPQNEMSQGDACVNLVSGDKDYLKSQTMSTTYYAGWGWYGSLEVMTPGEGYMMKVSSLETLEYPSSGGARKAALKPKSYSGKITEFAPNNYENSGSLTARVSVFGADAGSGDVLYAYVGSECRGVVDGGYFEPLDALLFPLMIHSNAEVDEEIEFKYYSKERDAFYRLNEMVTFRKDMILNDAYEPMLLSAAEEITGEMMNLSDKLVLRIGPNPVREKMLVSYGVSLPGEVKIEVYDMLGRLVDVLMQEQVTFGEHVIEWSPEEIESGAYIIQLMSGGERIVKQFIYQK